MFQPSSTDEPEVRTKEEDPMGPGWGAQPRELWLWPLGAQTQPKGARAPDKHTGTKCLPGVLQDPAAAPTLPCCCQ